MFEILKQRKSKLIGVSLLMIIGQICHVYAATINAEALNQLIALRWEAFLLQEVYLMLVWCSLIFFNWLTKLYQMKLIQELNTIIRKNISQQLAATDYQSYHQRSVNTYLSWLNNDIHSINKQGFEPLFQIIKGISGTILAVIMLFRYHWSLVVVTFISVACMLTIPKLFGRKMQEVSLKTSQQNEQFLKDSETILNGFDVFYSLSLLREIPRRIVQSSLLLKQVILKQTHLEAAVGAIGFTGNIFFQIALTIFTGYLAIKGFVSIGTIEATGALTGIIFTTLGELSSQLAFVHGCQPIFQKFRETIPKSATISTTPTLAHTAKNGPALAANHLSYAYGQHPIFQDIQLCFEKNGKYLITGESGSGKSTLLKILMGFLRNYTGSITFYGQEIRDLPTHYLAQHILFLPQEAYLLSTTIQENLCLGQDFSEKELKAACLQAGLTIHEPFEDFLHREVGDRGQSLSGGQRQRIALARGATTWTKNNLNRRRYISR
ncbi:ABC transporter ATP-binding protein/permease [Streptococcus sp. O1]|uniref:ATP-binding cassette domain-containing protein n=1 Tax=Streptococcus sp. O1 TaxID=2928735 RepID=UPI00211AF7E6|nr:ABC transporter ATP-binding protein [Streptococcus sp. O1]MCQ9212899.1 ABC transporter ATP-binding protein/permease [Streptococcus sp. O1]